MTDAFRPGPTGRFPKGKLNDDDEGELLFMIGKENGNVVLDFGKPVTWLGLPPEDAVSLAEALVQAAVGLGHVPCLKTSRHMPPSEIDEGGS